MLAVAAAVLDRNANLIEANAGFLKLFAADEPGPIGRNISHYFMQPDFAALMRAAPGANGEIHRGLLTFGHHQGRTRTLLATVWRHGEEVRILAEHNVEELERLSDKVLDLNRDYAQAQLELAQAHIKLLQRQGEILALSLSDHLTGVGNRRRFEQALSHETGGALRSGAKLSALVADLDHFKTVNDTYGHQAGDRMLVAFAHMLVKQTRKSDVVARMGGEEFMVLMPDTGLDHAFAIAERIRHEAAISRVDPLTSAVTASIGVAQIFATETSHDFMRRIDRALYAAKHGGRNRVVLATEGGGLLTSTG